MTINRVEVWYDRYTRSWVVQLKSWDGNQIGDADYVATKGEALRIRDAYLQQQTPEVHHVR